MIKSSSNSKLILRRFVEQITKEIPLKLRFTNFADNLKTTMAQQKILKKVCTINHLQFFFSLRQHKACRINVIFWKKSRKNRSTFKKLLIPFRSLMRELCDKKWPLFYSKKSNQRLLLECNSSCKIGERTLAGNRIFRGH